VAKSRLSVRAVLVSLALLAAGVSPLAPATAVDTIDWLDHSFGGGLQTFDDSPDRDFASNVAIQKDGKVVVVATTGPYLASTMTVRRFLPDGRADTGFGTGGTVVIPRAGLSESIGLAIQDDGRIVAAATGASWGQGNIWGWGLVARLSADGALDPTFSGGTATVDVPFSTPSEFGALALAPGGKLVMAGSFTNGENDAGLMVARLDSDGTPDESFADGGMLLRHPPGGYGYWTESVSAVAVRPDGAIIVGGGLNYPSVFSGLPMSSWFLLTKITPSGTFDTAFGDRGTVHTDIAGGSGPRDSSLTSMAVQSDGKIVAAGTARHSDGGPSGYGYSGFAVARYLPDGRLDPGFGSSGIVVSLAPPSSRNGGLSYGGASASAVAVDAKGRIVTAGSAWGFLSLDMTLARYTPTGLVDTTFGRSGWMKIERETDNDDISALAIQPDGAVVFAGSVDVYKVLALGRIAAPDTSTTIRAWGWNGLGQLGADSTLQQNVAVPAPGTTGAVTPAGGGFHSLSLQGDGTVLAVGWNGVGQLGDGSTTDRDTLTRVPGLDNVTHIAAGAHHSLAVRDGRVYAWGWNATGQLGDGTKVDRHTPVVVPGLTGVVQVAAGAYHSLALRNDGTIWAWGWNGVGQLGDGTTVDRLRPTQVTGIHSATMIAAGALHSLVVGAGPEKSSFGIWSWGWNGMGQSDPLNAGFPVMASPRFIWPTFPIAIAAGGYHNVVINGDGAIYTWGWNAVGQLGNGTTNPAIMVQVTTIPDPISISAGGAHSMATDTSGRTWAWGWNALGQLGDGTTTDRPNPVLVQGADGATALSGGWYHSMGAVSGG
jgi:uncharacterized delta-60 repeat protein